MIHPSVKTAAKLNSLMKMNLTPVVKARSVLSAGLCASASLHAAITAEDHFLVNYPTTPGTGEYSGNGLGAQSPTLTGWSVGWDKASSNDIIGNPMGLSHPGFASSGGCGSAPDGTRSGHPLATAYTAATAGTVYLSVLMKMDQDAPGAYRTMELHSGGYDDGAHRKLQLGQSLVDLGTAGYGLRLFNDNSFRLDLGAMDTAVNLFVIKFVFSDAADADSVTVWRNPDSTSFGTGSEPAGGQSLTGFNLQFDRTSIAHFGGARDIHLDEIRIGESWADVTPTGPAAQPAVLRYTFDDATLGDWTELTPANTNSGPRNWAISPGAFPGGNMARHGSYAVGQNIQGGSQDSGHPTLVLRSPKFTLNGNGDLSAWLFGGHGYNADATGRLVSNLPANAFDNPGAPTFPSFLGVALRVVTTGVLVLAGKKNDPGDSWQQVTFTAAQLDALETANPGHVYTLDLLDVRAGGWGWLAMDSVVIPGTIVPDTNTPPTISDVADISIDWAEANPVATPVGPVDVTVDDLETPVNDLILAAVSSNPTLVPNANLELGGSGMDRTVTITPVIGAYGSSTITLTVTDGADTKSDTFVFTVGPPPVALRYDFDDTTLQGWTVVGTDTRQFFAIQPPSVNSPNQTPQAGGGFVGLHIPAFGGDPFYFQDSTHNTLWLRSPKFKLDASGLPLFAHLCGGGAGSTLPSNNPAEVPATTVPGGFRGIALRNAGTNQFVLTGTKASNGGDWQEVSFTPAQLAALDPTATYTLDLIDAAQDGWAWVNMDTVGIPGTVVATPYESWAATKGLSGADAAFDADPDNDGIENGLEFVLGGEPNPANPDAATTPVLPTAQAQGDNLIFTYIRTDASAYLNPVVEFDADLVAPWTIAVDPDNAAIEVTDGSPADTVVVTIPKNGAPSLFVRLKVVQPAP